MKQARVEAAHTRAATKMLKSNGSCFTEGGIKINGEQLINVIN